ncbi:uncharacterized protein [Coffea arabica]|uniref:Leucine-rich repeat-containing N-terminal plant-type domain-containing protein n=1 Tax=Coffea arabica TaxID=13443 RepID=A0ABM4UE81_COFAR
MGGLRLFSEFLLIAAILLCFPSINTDATCITSEKQALLGFKKSLIDPSGRLSSWNDNVDCCQWQAVICSNKSGHVIQLRLQNPVDDLELALSGNINHSLLNLTQLRHLDLSLNDFSGLQIPTFLGSLKSLRYLNLSQARFQGMVPYQLGNLSSLRTFSVVGEFWSSLHSDNLQWLAGLSNLKHLELSHVDLSPASNWLQVINMIPSLVEIRLSSCHLFQISQLIHSNFSSLTVLDLSGNDFRHFIPRWIFYLPSLASLDLSKNLFLGPLPRGPWNMTSLNYLDLSSNHLDGSLPDELIHRNNLISLNLQGNQFEGSLDGIRNWSSLVSLNLSENHFTTILPNVLFTLSSLVSLDLRSNQFQGYIPGFIANISNLQNLDLSHNNLSSSLPSELFTLKDLVTVDAGGNHLSGPIPSTIGNCTKLKHLRLTDNSLAMSKWLYNCTSLELLGLRGNALSGSIPSNLGKLSSLEYIDISKNKLTGTLPESLGQLSKLETLLIYNNLMEGMVSGILLDNLTSLKYFDASGNSLTLKANASWIPRAQFERLGLGSWNLGLQFPIWLQSQKNLQYLNLSSTRISDTIPSWLFNSATGVVSLSHNQLHGGISHFLCEVKNGKPGLTVLDLKKNSLSGEIPDCWMNYPNITYISLKSNNFIGSIPRSLFSLEYLSHLDLGRNSLTGSITSTL